MLAFDEFLKVNVALYNQVLFTFFADFRIFWLQR